jgi:D-lyxose ketol-isomerase
MVVEVAAVAPVKQAMQEVAIALQMLAEVVMVYNQVSPAHQHITQAVEAEQDGSVQLVVQQLVV